MYKVWVIFTTGKKKIIQWNYFLIGYLHLYHNNYDLVKQSISGNKISQGISINIFLDIISKYIQIVLILDVNVSVC